MQSCQWTAIGLIQINNYSIDLSVKLNNPTYPSKPFSIIEEIMFLNFSSLKENLSKYIFYSICDSINPKYQTPILKYSKNYSLSDFYPLRFMDSNISSDQGLYEVLTFLSLKKQLNKYQIILVDVGIFWRYYLKMQN